MLELHWSCLYLGYVRNPTTVLYSSDGHLPYIWCTIPYLHRYDTKIVASGWDGMTFIFHFCRCVGFDGKLWLAADNGQHNFLLGNHLHIAIALILIITHIPRPPYHIVS